MTAAKEPILRDVAAMASVSIKTASRVLNDDPSVAPKTRENVRAAMLELGYRPDPAARSLRVGRDLSVGVVVEDIGDVFVASLVARIEARLSDAGYQVLITSSHRDPIRERAIVQDLQQRRCAGVIVMPSTETSLVGLRLGTMPVVFVDRVGEFPGSRSVVSDDFALARLGTQHLIDHGHQRIAILSDSQKVPTTRDRHLGFRSAMADAGHDVDRALVRDECLDESFVRNAVSELFALQTPPTALIATNTRLSLGAVPALHLVRRTETALLAFGDFPMAESLTPAVTVIDHSPHRLGQIAADTLLERLRGDGSHMETDPIVVPADLIARGSGELPPCTTADNKRVAVPVDTA
ncbi:LacI family DNA-binding transcriptional regulator [Demequina sp. SO4-13]|uniref:LacI family DNA-binding transcriptional regulator n=1 Tax=Demequina sp. SO4-13 TaxID=3401027 RepID=UPI003AF97329